MQNPRHSRLGITSLIFFVLACASLAGSWVEDKANRAYLASKPPPYDLTYEYVLSGLFGCSGILLLLIGLGLGFAGFAQHGRRKLFPALGLALNAGMLFVLIALCGWIIKQQ
jgi:hypothetical protein